MKFIIKPGGEVKGGFFRFDLVLAEDDGKPLATIKGWRLADWKHVMPPMSFSHRGVRFAVVEVHDEAFTERIKESLLKKIDPDGSKRAAAETND